MMTLVTLLKDLQKIYQIFKHKQCCYMYMYYMLLYNDIHVYDKKSGLCCAQWAVLGLQGVVVICTAASFLPIKA